MYQDQTLTCRDCGKPFTWTASEQEFYASKGFSAPVRCPEDRAKNKQAKQGGSFSRGPREMHKIVCADCGEEGEVPFEPRDPSNVLCADCFRKKREAERGGGMSEMPTPTAVRTASDEPATPAAEEATDNADDDAAAKEPAKPDESAS